MALEPSKHVNGRMWPLVSPAIPTADPSAVGRPCGRLGYPRQADHDQYTAQTNPAVFFATRARLIPNDIRQLGIPPGVGGNRRQQGENYNRGR
jgi:hypothetical protein